MNTEVKDLIISYNDEKGFYCGDLQKPYFDNLMRLLVMEFDLDTQKFDFTSEIDMYFKIRQVNNHKYNIELREEDGSEWVFG